MFCLKSLHFVECNIINVIFQHTPIFTLSKEKMPFAIIRLYSLSVENCDFELFHACHHTE